MVYLLQEGEYYGKPRLIGVFTTLEKAVAAAERQWRNTDCHTDYVEVFAFTPDTIAVACEAPAWSRYSDSGY